MKCKEQAETLNQIFEKRKGEMTDSSACDKEEDLLVPRMYVFFTVASW